MSKDMHFHHSQEIFQTNISKYYKSRNRLWKNCFHKTAEATRELIGNKIDEKIVKSKLEPDLGLRNVEEIIILPEKR